MSKQKFRYDLHNTDDPDFDLDAYIDEQANADDQNFEQEFNSHPTTKRNLLALSVILIPAIWFFLSDPFSVFSDDSNFSSSQAGQTIVVERPEPNVRVITAPAAPVPLQGSNFSFEPGYTVAELDMSYTDYLAELKEYGYLDDFGGSASTRLYQNNVPVEYIDQFGKAEVLNNFGSTSISRLYQNQVPFDYIQNMADAGLLNNFGSTSISRLYQNQIPFEYIIKFKEANVLDDFGSTSISRLYQNGVPTEYISEIATNGYLNNFGSTSIVRLHQNQVPVSFLKALDEKGLLDDMSSESVVTAYQLEGQ